MGLSLFAVISLILDGILYPFILSVLILLIIKRNIFKGPFFVIFRIVLAADIMGFVSIIVSLKVPLIPELTDFFKNGGIIPSLFLLLLTFTSVIQFTGELLMTFNRFTLIWFPLKHQHIWKHQWYTILILFTALSPICWRLHGASIYSSQTSDNFYLSIKSAEDRNLNYLITSCIYFGTTSVAAILNVMSFAKLYCKKHTSSNIKVNEKNLLFVSSMILLAQLLRTSFNVLRLFFANFKELMDFASAMFSILFDIVAWTSGISLFLLSGTTRKEYMSFYFCQTPAPVSHDSGPKITPIVS